MHKKYKYQEVVFAVGAYDNDYDKMWSDIGQLIRILINDGYQCKVYDDAGVDIIVVQFDYREDELSNGQLRWCTWNECELLEQSNCQELHNS